MRIDITKTAIQNLLAQINLDNETAYNERHVVFEDPIPHEVEDNPRNTKILMKAVLGEGFSGTRTFYYIRVGLFSGRGSSTSIITIASDVSQDFLKTEIASVLGLLKSELVLTDIVMPIDVLTPGSVRVSAKSNSLVYVGSHTFELRVP